MDRVRVTSEWSRDPAAEYDAFAGSRREDGAPRETAVVADETKACKRYAYAGPPKISLATWNERPKRQVSIKTDRDYVIGIRQRLQQKTDAAGPAAKLQQRDSAAAPESSGSNKCAVSRVPVVKSVELKKPYAEQLQTASPVLALAEAIKAQAKLRSGYGGYLNRGGGAVVPAACTPTVGYRGNVPVAAKTRGDCENAATATARPSENKKDSGGGGGGTYTFGKLMNRPRKPREISANVVDPRQNLLESIRSFGGRDNLRKIRG